MFNRLSRLFQADFHAVLDQLEDPEAILKQSLREMDAEIRRLEQQLQHQKKNGERLHKQLAKCRQQEQEIEPQLDLCFKANNEDLAKNLLRQRLQWQRQQTVLQQQLDNSLEQQQTLEKQLQAFSQQFEELKQKAEIFVGECTIDNEAYSGAEFHTSRTTIAEHELELAWLQEKEKRSSTTAKTRADN